MAIPFCKFHGFGNDYIVIESGAIPDDVPVGALSIAMCSRNTGVGADGIAVLKKVNDTDADYFCEIINPDGSIAGFSGNGTRCAVAYLHYKGLWDRPRLRLRTLSGIKNYDLTERRGDGEFWFNAEIGKPVFECIDEPIDVPSGELLFSGVNVGNPVACIYVDDFDLDWRSDGREIEINEMFTARTNVVFIRAIDSDNVEIRIWERGAGETSSSGTCSTAAAVMSAYRKLTSREVLVHAPGGTTRIVWRDDDEMIITGRADLAFCGEWPHVT
jgi:diaminopimelate epimerase